VGGVGQLRNGTMGRPTIVLSSRLKSNQFVLTNKSDFAANAEGPVRTAAHGGNPSRSRT
jgi:hypothetical protein